MPTLRRVDKPPKPGPELWIMRMKKGERFMFTIVSKTIWACMTHWAGDHSEPCLEPKKQCNGCKRGMPSRYKGYLHVWCHEKRDECFVELTPTAVEHLEAMLGKGQPWRGHRVSVRRMDGDKSRLKVELHAYLPDQELPPEKDPHKTLCKLWGLDDLTMLPNAETVVSFTPPIV